MLSVKPASHHQAERRDDRDRDRDRRDDRRAQAAEEQQHDERREQRAEHEVLEHLVGRGADLDRVIAHDLDRVAGRQLLAELGDLRLDRVDDGDRVRAGLLADLQRDRRDAVADRGGLRVFFGVLDAVAGAAFGGGCTTSARWI